MNKNLIIDGQILQTAAWHRGMGKYLLQVLRELSNSAAQDIQIALLFNSSLQCEKERYDTVKFMSPNIKQIHHALPLPDEDGKRALQYRDELSGVIKDNFPEGDNYFMISALFFFDFYTEFPEACHRLLLFYDLTPLLFWKDLGGYFPPELYMQRFERVLQAEKILAISETTRRDLINVLGLNPEKVVSVNGGFTKVAESAHKPRKIKVPNQYVLFPTGDMPHKNNPQAIKGYEAYCRHNRNAPPLLITSRFLDKSKKVLSAISDKIIFTDNVSDEELEWLYENASAILFASKYEGLGLPILDAVANSKPVITSRISVFEEMSKDAFYYFDPDNYDELAEALQNALAHKGFKAKLKYYPRVLSKYTWYNTCRGILDSLEKEETKTDGSPSSGIIEKPRIAVVCIHPGVSGQIGRTAEALNNSLKEVFDVDYYLDANGYHFREMERPTFLDFFDNKTIDILKLDLRTVKKYKTVLYLLDEAAFPSRVAQRACVLRGTAITSLDNTQLDHQNEMLKELALDNQERIYKLKSAAYEDYQLLTHALKHDLENAQLLHIHPRQDGAPSRPPSRV